MPNKITLTIDSLNSDGQGVARREGKVYFVPWAIPGDVVEVVIKNESPQLAECLIDKWVTLSSDRVTPPCPHFFECGGCQLQHMSYAAQLQHKTSVVKEALDRIGRQSSSLVHPTLPSPQEWNYRSRIQIHQNQKGQWGFYKKNSHDVVPVKECPIANENVNSQLSQLWESSQKKTPTKNAEKSRILRSDLLPSFSQAHSGMNKLLVDQVIEYVEPDKKDKIFDLYAGAGNYTLALAKFVERVVAIEKDSVSVNFGLKESSQQKIENISWRQGPVYDVLKQVKQEGHKCHKMIVNPPRQGLENVIERMLEFHPQKIIYVSCHPGTWARDVARLHDSGYKLKHCQPLDMFPQTVHVETVSLFLK